MITSRSRFIVVAWLLIQSVTAHALTNQLEGHPSPYLALHGSDPVAWQDWSQAAVDLARHEDKLLYISVGYFSCHWCHVMQQESYKNPEVAKLLNSNYIPVKVDRELESALDARLIEFAQQTQGRAGWPLNVFLTPDGHPLYAVLYMPPDRFRQVLTKLNALWLKEGENLLNIAAREAQAAAGPGDPTLDGLDVNGLVISALSQAVDMADSIQGGFGQSQKFPMAPQLGFLLERYREKEDAELGSFLRLTLDEMAGNGMYDHIGDGFFRYSTDPGWEVPHFEKMLYDNAQLAVLYLRAGKLFDEPRYSDIAARTLAFLSREMAADSGAMYASFSAVDDESVEGGYYLWQREELSRVLNEGEREAAVRAWDLRGPLRFEAGYLAKGGLSLEDVGTELGISPSEAGVRLGSAQEKLFAARSSRVLPVDTKLLAGWNGLALAAFSEAAATTGDDTYQDQARKIRDYITTRLWDGDALYRAVDGTRKLGKASLEDYAYVGLGLMAWADLTRKPSDYEAALKIVEQAWRRFYDGGWRRGETSLIAEEPPRDLISDGPMPSPSALVIRNTLLLTEYSSGGGLEKLALSALNSGTRRLTGNWFWNVSHLQALLDASRASSGN
jgi:hypothetical protein